MAVLFALTASKKAEAAPTRSTTIALTSDETRLVVVNREANSISIIKVKNADGKDVSTKIAEIPVGEEPRCVAIHPTDRAAYVTNAISGTISVVNLNQHTVVSELDVGTAGLRADGGRLFPLRGEPYRRHRVDNRHQPPAPPGGQSGQGAGWRPALGDRDYG
jgi:hypothetical protein